MGLCLFSPVSPVLIEKNTKDYMFKKIMHIIMTTDSIKLSFFNEKQQYTKKKIILLHYCLLVIPPISGSHPPTPTPLLPNTHFTDMWQAAACTNQSESLVEKMCFQFTFQSLEGGWSSQVRWQQQACLLLDFCFVFNPVFSCLFYPLGLLFFVVDQARYFVVSLG